MKHNLDDDPDYRPSHTSSARNDYDDLEVPRRPPKPATTHYLIANVFFTVYGALLFIVGALITLLGLLMAVVDRIDEDSEGLLIVCFLLIWVGTAYLTMSIMAYSQRSLRWFKILSGISVFLGIFPMFGYFVFGWLGLYGLGVASQLSVRKRFRKPIPEYFERLSKETAQDVIFRDPVKQEELLALKRQMIMESNPKIVPLRLVKILGLVLLGLLIIAAIPLYFELDDDDDFFLLCLGFSGVMLLYWVTYLAFKWIRRRQNYKAVITIMVAHLVLGFVPYFGILNYALGAWLLTILLKPEVRSGYRKGLR